MKRGDIDKLESYDVSMREVHQTGKPKKFSKSRQIKKRTGMNGAHRKRNKRSYI